MNLREEIQNILASDYCGNDDCVAIDSVMDVFKRWALELLGDEHPEFCEKRGKQFKKCHVCLIEERLT